MKDLTLLLVTFLILLGSSCKKINDSITYGCTDPASITYDSNANKDDGFCIYPVFEKKVLVFKGTGQRCTPCGKYGVPISDSLLKVYPNTELVAIHYSDDFQNDKLKSIKMDLLNGGIPYFIVGNEILQGSLDVVFSRVRDELNRVPDVQVVTDFTIHNNKMSIDVQTLRKKETNKDFNVAVYILEDKQKGFQDGVVKPPSSGFVHNHVLRMVLDDETYGVPISYSDEISSNHFTVNLKDIYSTEEQPLVPANCYPVVVIWEKKVYGFEFVNVTR